MNMISTGAFLNEMDASNKQSKLAEKFAAVWEKKNAKAARAGGVSLMALSLAACGGSSSTTTTSTDTSSTDTSTTVTPISSALTVGVDSVTGTAGDDTITAARIDGVQTWNSGDVISGGEGTDTLTATLEVNVTPASGAITGVENLVVTGDGAIVVDFSSATANFITGVTSITNIGSNNTMTFDDITAIAEMTVNGVAAGDTTTFSYNDSVLSGAADSVTLNLVGVNDAVTIGTNSDADGDYETLVINATGSASDLNGGGGLGADATTVDINASAALDLGTTASFAAVTSFDASDSTAGVTAVLANKAAAGTTAVDIKGGAGNDSYDLSNLTAANHGAVTVDMGAGTDTVTLGGSGASDFTIAGGDGVDTLSLSIVPAAATHTGVSGFETLTLTNAVASGATDTVNMALLNSNAITTINVTSTTAASEGATDEVVTISNAKDEVTTIGMGALDTDDIDVNFTRLVDGTANAVTFKTSADSAMEDLAANDEETITFNTASGSVDYATLSGTDLTSLVGTGDNDLDLGTVTASKLATVDMTGMQSNGANNTTAANDEGDFIADLSSSTVNMTVTGNASTSHAGILNITTGSGSDNVTGTNNADTINAGAGSDTISSGAGDDDITGGSGVDTITTGTGNDQVFITAGADGATAKLNLWDIITDFEAGATDDELSVNIEASPNTTVAEVIVETSSQITATTTVNQHDVVVYTGNQSIDTSGANAADLTAINTALFGGSALEASKDMLAVFSADTDGDGIGEEVQVWIVGEDDGTAGVADFAYQIATFSNIDATSDLVGIFHADNFNVT